MTNYRLEICALHDKPQFNYCPDCGSPLIEEEGVQETHLICSKSWVHIRIFLRPHEGDPDGDCEGLRVR